MTVGSKAQKAVSIKSNRTEMSVTRQRQSRTPEKSRSPFRGCQSSRNGTPSRRDPSPHLSKRSSEKSKSPSKRKKKAKSVSVKTNSSTTGKHGTKSKIKRIGSEVSSKNLQNTLSNAPNANLSRSQSNASARSFRRSHSNVSNISHRSIDSAKSAGSTKVFFKTSHSGVKGIKIYEKMNKRTSSVSSVSSTRIGLRSSSNVSESSRITNASAPSKFSTRSSSRRKQHKAKTFSISRNSSEVSQTSRQTTASVSSKMSKISFDGSKIQRSSSASSWALKKPALQKTRSVPSVSARKDLSSTRSALMTRRPGTKTKIKTSSSTSEYSTMNVKPTKKSTGQGKSPIASSCSFAVAIPAKKLKSNRRSIPSNAIVSVTKSKFPVKSSASVSSYTSSSSRGGCKMRGNSISPSKEKAPTYRPPPSLDTKDLRANEPMKSKTSKADSRAEEIRATLKQAGSFRDGSVTLVRGESLRTVSRNRSNNYNFRIVEQEDPMKPALSEDLRSALKPKQKKEASPFEGTLSRSPIQTTAQKIFKHESLLCDQADNMAASHELLMRSCATQNDSREDIEGNTYSFCTVPSASTHGRSLADDYSFGSSNIQNISDAFYKQVYSLGEEIDKIVVSVLDCSHDYAREKLDHMEDLTCDALAKKI